MQHSNVTAKPNVTKHWMKTPYISRANWYRICLKIDRIMVGLNYIFWIKPIMCRTNKATGQVSGTGAHFYRLPHSANTLGCAVFFELPIPPPRWANVWLHLGLPQSCKTAVERRKASWAILLGGNGIDVHVSIVFTRGTGLALQTECLH